MNHSFVLRLFQVFVEALIPILGFFFWHWSFYFILLFYFLDFLATSVWIIFKIKKINAFNQKKEKMTLGLIILLLSTFIGIIVFCYLMLLNIYPNFSFWNQTIAFFMLKDMGIPQGIFLIPLVAYVSYLNYKMQFLIPKKYESLNVKRVYNHYLKATIIALTVFFIAFLITYFISISESLAVIILVTILSLYSLFEKNRSM